MPEQFTYWELQKRSLEKRRRWNKAHPPSHPNPVYTQPMFPLVDTNGQAGFDQIEREDLVSGVRHHLKMILYTIPGEIISDIDFGVGIRYYLFANEREARVRSLEGTIQNQISKYLGYLSSFSVNVDTSNLFNHVLSIQIKYSVDDLRVEDVVLFTVNP